MAAKRLASGVSRQVKALAIVALAILAIPCIDQVVQRCSAEGQLPASGISASDVFEEGADPLETLGQIELELDGFSAQLPESVEEEMGLPAGSKDVRVSADGEVVGYLMGGTADAAQKEVGALMEEKGWSEVELGTVEGATYMKGEGVHRWALVTCVQVGNSTSVVVRCPRA